MIKESYDNDLGMTELLLYKLTWPEVKEYLKANDQVLFPTGSTEQHGKHIAEDNDAFTALEVFKRVAEKTGVLVAPVMPLGYSPHHMAFPGTVTLPFEVLVQVYKEVCKSLFCRARPHCITFVEASGSCLPRAAYARCRGRDACA